MMVFLRKQLTAYHSEKQPTVVFFKKRCFQKFRKIHGKTPQKNCLKKEALAQMFSSEFFEISKNTFLKNTSERLLSSIINICHGSKYRTSRPKAFFKKSGLTNIGKFTGKCLQQSLLKKGPRHRCFPANFEKFVRTPFLQKTPAVASVNTPLKY